MDLLQWPAFLITVGAAWLVGSQRPGRRKAGFWGHLLGNVLWVAWGVHSSAWALIALQFCLVAMNVRGARQNQASQDSAKDQRTG